jgi:methyl-accepting chemotaxis protein
MLVAEAGSTMNEIVESVKRVTDIMSEISEASREQSAGIEQVNLSIMQIDSVTQQNAALVEEAAAAATSLQQQADNLVQAVNVFKSDPHLPHRGPMVEAASRPVVNLTSAIRQPGVVAAPVNSAALPSVEIDRGWKQLLQEI